jgi:hypothetical protein
MAEIKYQEPRWNEEVRAKSRNLNYGSRKKQPIRKTTKKKKPIIKLPNNSLQARPYPLSVQPQQQTFSLLHCLLNSLLIISLCFSNSLLLVNSFTTYSSKIHNNNYHKLEELSLGWLNILANRLFMIPS